MKKWLLTTLLALGTIMVQANDYDYSYLTLEAADGTTTSVAVESLSLSFADGQLVATNADGSQTFTLSQLSKMYFTTTTSGISQSISANTHVEVFTVGGLPKGSFDSVDAAKATLGAGLYIMKSGNRTLKIAVK